MAEHRRRLYPLEPMFGEWQRPPERRGDAEGVHRRTDVVREARQRQLGRSRPASDGMVSLEDDNLAARLRQHDGRTEAVGAGPDDDGIHWWDPTRCLLLAACCLLLAACCLLLAACYSLLAVRDSRLGPMTW